MEKCLTQVDSLAKRLESFEKNFRKCSKANRTKGYLDGRVVGLDELWKRMCKVDEEIESLRTDEDQDIAYIKDDMFAQLEEKYFNLKGEIKDQLEALEPQRQTNTNQNQNNNQNNQQQNQQSNVKLPKLPLPTFAGSYDKWMSFKDRFLNAMEKQKSMSNVDKLEYLKSCLTGDAEKAIQRFQITEANYTAAWNQLNKMYDNKRILQDTEIETIIDRKEMRQETARELREFLDVMRGSLEALRNLNVDTTSWDPILVILVKRKLAFKTREEWEKQLETTEIPTYTQLIEFLEKRFRTVENLELVGGLTSVNEVKYQVNNINKNKSDQAKNQRPNCLVCNNTSHSLMICETFLNMSLSNRSAFVNAKKLCKNCLAVGHMIRDCKSKKRCFKCNKEHHTLLHRDDFERNGSTEPSHSRQSFVTHNRTEANGNSNYQSGGSANSNPFRNQGESSYNRNYIMYERQNQHPGGRIQSSRNTEPNQQTSNRDRRNLTTVAKIQNPSKKLSERETLFPTAIIKVKSKSGIVHNLRALLDQCSEDAFVKESVVKMLGGEVLSIPAFEVTGLSGVVTSKIEKATQFGMVIDDEILNVNANIVQSLVGLLPKAAVNCKMDLFRNIKLADSNFATPNNVDVLLGTKVYYEILLGGVLKEGGYLAQNTKLGWIISGKEDEPSTTPKPKKNLMCLHTQRTVQPDEILKKFWEMEEAPRKKRKFTEEERKCEEIFNQSYRRMEDGRPQVKLPFKESPQIALGESRGQAIARWLSMERKLNKDEKLKIDYMAAIQEYIDLGHMERIKMNDKQHTMKQKDGKVRHSCYYIPHHAVIKEESKTTKTRIVFDASAKTSSGKSLNDILLIGPTIQESLIVRLMKWRVHRYALRGDITKMYRQVKVYKEDEDYQRVVFRFDERQPIEEFTLNTLTFGTASAAYMATKTLQQIAKDEEKRYPTGSRVVKTDFHVDDLLTGGETEESVKAIWREVRELLSRAKFPMRKWSSNSNKVLQAIPPEECEFEASEVKMEDTLKTLGIGWSPVKDYFFFKAPEFNEEEKLTKRSFLSQAAKLFDPLGWLGPAVMKPKILFQRMWKERLAWDEPISKELQTEWIEFRNELHQIEQIRIPRWFGWSKRYKVELHGFCDASISAYGAVIYIKTTNEVGNSKIELVIAKSRVAPVKTVRLPRLELCGAALLAELMNVTSTELNVEKFYCWTDSSITIDWINSIDDKYKTFVANRIAEIQEYTEPKQWRHVEGTQNPADCLSRGLNPKELVEHQLWWHGPTWLHSPKELWPKNPNVKIPEDQLELKSKRTLTLNKVKINEVIESLWKRYKSFNKLVRVVARIRTLKSKVKREHLTLDEIESERLFWIKLEQEKTFKEEIESLKGGQPISSKSKLLQFNPFIDANGVLRVGGRLREALIDFDSKHQIIIPKNSILSQMIINDAHEITKHGGTQLTMTYTRMQYWIIDTRKSVRNHIHKCVKCHRFAQKLQTQLMGTLPDPRVNMNRAFLHTGVDYAGPIQVLTRRKPGRRETTKAWVAVFVCLCTRAIHLEVVSKLASQEFLAAFTRFRGRRGLPSNMYSDNSLTFVGTKNEMDEDLRIIKEQLEPELADIVLKDKIQWHFIPPHAPHWGGIWEAGVKSMKHHVRRVVGESIYTFEEITTALVEIEAVLNSRPLCPVSNDPNDLSILTPGHFLIGDALLSPPRPSLLEINPNRLGVYKQISQRVEHFAKRWKKEYLSTLQNRRKWMRQCENVETGDLVIIKDDDYPPMKWNLGRVTEVFPDEDGLVRSVMVRTEKSEYTRPIHKISILPIDKPLEPTQPNK